MTNVHWHVATGLAGYGPNASDTDGYATADNVRDLTSLIRWELDSAADYNHQAAQSLAESGDYESAWNTRELSDTLTTLGMNLDYERRASAPLYADNPIGLDAEMRSIISEAFPLDITDNTRLYVWICDAGDDCDSAQDDD